MVLFVCINRTLLSRLLSIASSESYLVCVGFEAQNADVWTPAKRRQVMISWRDHINHEMDLSKELDADFNFLKIHLMSHWVEQIRRYGTLQQYSAETHEQAHKTNLKDGWNASNHNNNYLPQIISFHRRILCFEIRELNLQALALH